MRKLFKKNATNILTKALMGCPLLRSGFVFTATALAFLGFLSLAHAVNPPPDGGYPGFNTAEGQNALLSLDTSTGFANTAVGALSLPSSVDVSFNTAVGAGTLSLNTGNENTAVGAAALLLNTTGEDNTAVGVDALLNNSIGGANTAIGNGALLNNTTGGSNTATGAFALFNNTTGTDNTAIGNNALATNNIGSLNTAIGVAALDDNTTGVSNTAIGVSALTGNTTGNNNTAAGVAALFSNTTGSFNTATGLSALHDNTVGESNTADGDHALFENIDGDGNTAIGTEALNANGSGDDNTATGLDALHNNAGGSFNTAYGVDSLLVNNEGSGNTAVGSFALSNIVNGDSNVAVGENAGENLTGGDSNNIDIGFDVAGVAGESNTVRIGNPDITTTIIRGISGQTIPSGSAVLVAANGQLGTTTSSRRFKEKIKAMDKASEALFSLKPVFFRYTKEIDPAGTQQFGLIAEDVEKISPDLVVRDENGTVNTVRYDQVNAMLLNEFLKAHAKMEQQQATIARQQKQIQALGARLDQQATQIQKVSDKIARSTTFAANGSE